MANLRIKKGDTVVMLSGKDKGKKGKVEVVLPADRKVVVEGLNMVTCHTKPRRPGETGGIVRKESAVYAGKVQVVCPKCSKGTRVAHKREMRTVAGREKMTNVRVCKHCGAEL